MILKENYDIEHIHQIVKKYGGSNEVFERVLCALALLQSLKDVNLDFVFKGGTCLMLLLKEPHRFSTDIDIVVKPEVNIDVYVAKAGQIFPFVANEEHKRIQKNGIEKRHFKFSFESRVTKNVEKIILDVVFEETDFIQIKSVEIKSPLLLTRGSISSVNVPTVDYLIADKLTAFAPNTIGILYSDNKDLEIIKQMHDVAILFDRIVDLNQIKDAYKKFASMQFLYRGMEYDIKKSLDDTIQAAISIISEGRHYPQQQKYSQLKSGIQKMKTHVFGGYIMRDAISHAIKVLYLSIIIRYDLPLNEFRHFDDSNIERTSVYSNLNRIKKIYPTAFPYIKVAINAIENNKK